MEKILKELKVADKADAATIAAIRKKPFYAQLMAGVTEQFVQDMRPAKLIKMIETAAYMGVDARIVVNQLLYRLGECKQTFESYFRGPRDAYEPVHSKFGNAVLAEMRGIIGPTPYFAGQIYAPDATMDDAIRASNKRLVIKLLGEGKIITDDNCLTAAMYADAQFMKWFIARDEATSPMLTTAVNAGNLDVLPVLLKTKWMRFNKCQGDHPRHFECVRYLLENKAPLGDRVVGNAIKAGHADCLAAMLDHKVPDPGDSLHSVISCEHRCIWDLFIKRGLVSDYIVSDVFDMGNLTAAKWLTEAGYVVPFNTMLHFLDADDGNRVRWMEFWREKFHAHKIVTIVADGKSDVEPNRIRCGSFNECTEIVRLVTTSIGGAEEEYLKMQNHFAVELLKTRKIEYNGIVYSIKFELVLYPLNDTNIHQIVWEAVELVIQGYCG